MYATDQTEAVNLFIQIYICIYAYISTHSHTYIHIKYIWLCCSLQIQSSKGGQKVPNSELVSQYVTCGMTTKATGLTTKSTSDNFEDEST